MLVQSLKPVFFGSIHCSPVQNLGFPLFWEVAKGLQFDLSPADGFVYPFEGWPPLDVAASRSPHRKLGGLWDRERYCHWVVRNNV